MTRPWFPHRPFTALALLAGLALAGGGCTDAAAGSARAGAVAPPAGATAPATPAAPAATAPRSVGGFASLEQALADFREGLPVVTALDSGERSRDALVRRFVRAVARADTTDVRRMMVSRAEFAHLYYPTSPYTRPPSRQGAPLVWFLHIQESQKGITRVLDRFGGRPLALAGYACDPAPVVEGENRLWTGCRLRLALPAGDVAEHRFFGSILERGGRFKIYSYRNDF